MHIKAEDIQLTYGSYVAIQKLSLRIQKGEIVSIIGPNGSGKSTVLKGLTRLIKYKQGKIDIDGTALDVIDSKEFARKVAVLPQRHAAPPDFKVRDLVAYGRVPHQKWFEKVNAEDERIIDEAMRATGVYAMRDKSIHACSGGEAQRVWIATVLSQEPEILFLDEPTTFLDIAHQLEMMRMIKRLNRERGLGIVMVLHDLSHALEVSDRIVVLKDGAIYAEGPPEEVICCQMMKDVYDVDCQIHPIKGRHCPIIAYQEIT